MASSNPSEDEDIKCSTTSGEVMCPTCSQPVKVTSDSDVSMQKNHSKRKGPALTSAKAKLRSSDSIPDGKFTTPWYVGQPVWVYTFKKDRKPNESQWEHGFVYKYHSHDDGTYEIEPKVQSANGKWDDIPHTIKSYNYDPIPNADFKRELGPDYKMSKYIQQRDPREDGLSGIEVKQFQSIKYHSKSILDSSKVSEQDAIGKSILDSDPNSLTSMRNVIYSLMVNDDVKKTVYEATKEKQCTAQHALAYLVGQLCGIELSEQSKSDIDPKGLLGQIGSNNDNINCPTSQVFLMSAMCARTKKRKVFDPSGGLYDSRGKAVLSDPKKLKARMDRLKTALAAIHSSQTDKPALAGPASALLYHGISLMIDMRGTSDQLLNKLAREGICRPAMVIRMWIQKLAEAIDPLNCRSPPPGERSQVLSWTADNADYHLFHTCVSVIPVANILLGIESEDETAHLNENYIKGLGKISELEAEHLNATEQEDKYAQNIIDNQNILAIMTAARAHKWLLASSTPGSRRRSTDKPATGSKVSFNFRSEDREGTVKRVSAKEVEVQFTDGDRVVKKWIALDNVNSCGVTAQPPAMASNRTTPVTQASKTFNGERHRFDPSTTEIVSVLRGLSSKHHETARRVIQEIINKHGEDNFYKAVHVIVADQEFMPTMLNEFFSRLGGEKPLPILPVLAIGHTMKGLSVSMMSYYQCYFDPILEALGVKPGSQESKRFYSGKVIRNTNRLVSNFTEMLAVSATRLYLDEVGRDRRIEVEERMMSPNSIISIYLVDGPDQTASSVTVMDPNMRPTSLIVTASLKAIARDFHEWSRSRWGTTRRSDVGPSGFEIEPSPNAEPQQADAEWKRQSHEIEQDERFAMFKTIPYTDNDDEPGLLSRCTNARLITKSSRKDKDTLAKKLFLLEVKHDRAAAEKFGPARRVPKGTNSTGLVIHDLLFGVERFAIVQGHLLTRVRP